MCLSCVPVGPADVSGKSAAWINKPDCISCECICPKGECTRFSLRKAARITQIYGKLGWHLHLCSDPITRALGLSLKGIFAVQKPPKKGVS